MKNTQIDKELFLIVDDDELTITEKKEKIQKILDDGFDLAKLESILFKNDSLFFFCGVDLSIWLLKKGLPVNNVIRKDSEDLMCIIHYLDQAQVKPENFYTLWGMISVEQQHDVRVSISGYDHIQAMVHETEEVV